MTPLERSALNESRHGAALNAKQWLSLRLPKRLRAIPLQRFGILLCERLSKGRRPPVGSTEIQIISPPSSIIQMQRTDLLTFCRQLGIASSETIRIKRGTRSLLELYLSGLALSYVADGDVLLGSVILRAAARIGFQNVWLDQTEIHLLDQQESDGGFGLVAAESELLGDDSDLDQTRLILTVEILWALAERAFSANGATFTPSNKRRSPTALTNASGDR